MKTYRFGPFQLDPAQGILSAGAAEVPLGAKAFETLRYLIENAGRVVSKRELIDGSVHGAPFVALVVMLLLAIRKVPISLKLAAAGIAAAVITGGPFLLDRRLAELE